MVKKICLQSKAEKIILSDPVRPHIQAHERLSPGREMYHLDEKAFLCLAYLENIPENEKNLMSYCVGPVAVAYTVWSIEKGMGRKIILAIRDLISKTSRFKQLVTLSPKTEMAMKFHLSNGAFLLKENISSNNFKYDL